MSWSSEIVFSWTPTVAISGWVKTLAGDGLQLDRRHRLAERVPHRDAALHGGDRGELEDAGDVAGGVDARHATCGRPGRRRCGRPGSPRRRVCSRLSPAVFGTVPTVIRACEPSTVRPSVSSTSTPFSVRCHRRGPAALGDPAAAGLEDLLEHLGGVGVLAGQHLVAGGDQRDRHAGLEVAGGELGAGDAGADDDEVLGHLLELVDVAPVEDPLAVGLGAGQHPRVGAGGDEDDVALQLLGDPAVGVERPRRGARPGRGSRRRAGPARRRSARPRRSAGRGCRPTAPWPGP